MIQVGGVWIALRTKNSCIRTVPKVDFSLIGRLESMIWSTDSSVSYTIALPSFFNAELKSPKA